MNHTPWTQEDAERWAREFGAQYIYTGEQVWTRVGFLAGLAKATEMIEEAPTIYGGTERGHYWETVIASHDTHSAKLVGVRKIEGEK